MGSRVEVEDGLVNHFKEIMTKYNNERDQDIDRIISLIPNIVTREDNENLTKPISMQEVEGVMQQMDQGKSLGPDEFTTNFFHHFWDMPKEKVWAIVEESRTNKGVLKDFNPTFLALIPKSEGADAPGKFRPIALCNVIYKIISKVIANRLKPLLLGIISPEQSWFVEGRKILDGIITVQEAIHSLKCTRIPGMLIKLDIAKSYDKLS